ncbi:hypothetical protein [Thaumasiovibrio sp. DFM-14]|uniref:hypothetical protein n=1 Tax=Thaumasiovibrio sp. DFM-14 TaxID=3384792 RepID=UPI0039A11A60
MNNIPHDYIACLDAITATETGITETTDLTDIDRAVATKIATIMEKLKVTDQSRQENKEFARFAAKPIHEKVHVGTFDTPKELLRKLAGKEKARNSLFPCVNIARRTEFEFAEPGEHIDVKGSHVLKAAGDNVTAVVNTSFVNLSYTVTLMAWEKSTVTRMALGLALWLRNTKRGRQHSFIAKTALMGLPVEQVCQIKARADLMPADASESFNEDRLNAVTFDIEVLATVFEAEEVTAETFRVMLSNGEIIK